MVALFGELGRCISMLDHICELTLKIPPPRVQLNLEVDQELSHPQPGRIGIVHFHVTTGKPSLLGRACVLKGAGSAPELCSTRCRASATLARLRSLPANDCWRLCDESQSRLQESDRDWRSPALPMPPRIRDYSEFRRHQFSPGHSA
jgi:hypothetical protein